MTICCHTEITRQWTDQEFADKLLLLPENLWDEVLRKSKWIDRQLSIGGKLLVLQVLKELGLDKQLSLSDLKYNTHNRPYFDAEMDFNIAHSGNMVVCIGTETGKTGVDIEQIKTIPLDDYHDHFTKNEWIIINNYKDTFEGFFDFWTRKEALLKAIGTGFHTPLSSVDVAEYIVDYNDTPYRIQKLYIHEDYKCHAALTELSGRIKLLPVTL